MSEYSDASLVLIPSGVKEGKLHSQKPLDGTGDFTVVRASSATRVNEQGLIETVAANVARIDYTDGSGCPALLVEDASTNLALWSEDLSDVSWVNLGTSVSLSNVKSPSNESNVYEVTPTLTTSFISNIIGGLIGDTYTSSIYIKNKNSVRTSILVRNSISLNSSDINWDGDKISSITNSTGILYYEELNDGWYRIYTTYTAVESAERFRVFPDSDSGINSVYLWGSQLEQISYLTSYIPTQATTVTRLADVVTVAPPLGVTEIIETIDSIDQTPITVIPATYQIPNGNINKIIMK